MTNLYLITYDLRKPDQNYKTLIDEIKKFQYWCDPLQSTWIIESTSSSTEIRFLLRTKMDNNDKLLVVSLDRKGSWSGMDSDEEMWLRQHFFQNC
jgi:hypothetical protein